jgi:hypothetical protein
VVPADAVPGTFNLKQPKGFVIQIQFLEWHVPPLQLMEYTVPPHAVDFVEAEDGAVAWVPFGSALSRPELVLCAEPGNPHAAGVLRVPGPGVGAVPVPTDVCRTGADAVVGAV